MRRLRRHATLENVPRIVLLSTRLGVEAEAAEQIPGEIIPVKGVLPGKKMLASADKLLARQKG